MMWENIQEPIHRAAGGWELNCREELNLVTGSRLSGNLTISQNKISNYTSYVDDYDNGGQVGTTYKKTDMALSPNIIAAGTISFYPVPVLEISLPAKFVGRRLSRQYPEQSKKNYQLLFAAGAYYLFPENKIHCRSQFCFLPE